MLYFTSGPADGENTGLFGLIAPAGYVRITQVSSSNGNLLITWVGKPPYSIQRKSNLLDANWVEVTTTSNLSATVPATEATGFFRISDKSSATP